jgi:hypothetical protein
MDALHHMTVEANVDCEALLVCPHEGCGRRVVLNRVGDIVILNKGDFFARHVGSVGPIDVSMSLIAEPERVTNPD